MAAEHKDNSIKVCLLGPSFDTGNLGVNALVEASIKVIVHRWSDAQITLLGSGRVDCDYKLPLFGRDIKVKSLPIRFSKSVWLPNHFLTLFFYAILLKVFPDSRMRDALAGRNPYLRAVLEADMVADITGGDSFSDMYGMRTFAIGYLRKSLIKLFGKKLVLLPQTYGPFHMRLTKVLARRVINYATLVYSRDKKGLDIITALIGDEKASEKAKFVPDVGFLLDPGRPKGEEIELFEKLKSKHKTLVGLNISGLLNRACEAGNNTFNLKIDYLALIDSIVEYLMKRQDTVILLVPHVVPLCKPDTSSSKNVHKKGCKEQLDSVACDRLYNRVAGKYPDRVFMVRGCYNHNETKYIIGLCDFFIGSRMHACIAALSQGIPVLGVAYSGKFHGVFESVGVVDCVADARNLDENGILEKLETTLDSRDRIHNHLKDVMPKIRENILGMFNVAEFEHRGGSDLAE